MFLVGLVEQVVLQVLEAEMTARLGVAPYKRSEIRRGHRDGYKSRQSHARVGTLTLRVPHDRDGTFSTRVFGQKRRTEKAPVLAPYPEGTRLYVEGASTSNVREITEVPCGTSFSKSLVSDLTGTLDAAAPDKATPPGANGH